MLNMVPQYSWLAGMVALLLAGCSFGAKPAEVSVSLDKAVSGGSDDIFIGQTEIVVMTIKLPNLITSGIKIELLPSTMETIFGIGEIINHTVGADLTSIQNSNWFNDVVIHAGPEYTNAEIPIYYNTRAAFDLGDVNNGGSNNQEIASTITIYYEIVYLSIGSYSDGDEYWVSCGMAYDSDSHIWISQFSYNLKELDSGFTPTNDYSLESVTEIKDDGQILTTDLTMTIRKAKALVKVEALTLTETTDVVPFKIEMVSAAKAYAFSFRTSKFLASQADSCAFKDTNQQSLELNLGTIINKESQKTSSPASDNQIVLRVSWMVTNASVVNNVYTLGVGVDVDSTEISVANFNVTVVSSSVAAPMSDFTLAVDGSNTVESGGVGIALVTMPIPAGSLHTYVMTLSTNVKSGTESLLSILSYSMGSRGDNIPCDLDDTVQLLTSQTDSVNPSVNNEANMTFSVLNTGMMTTNNLELKIAVLVLPTAVKDTIYELNIAIDAIPQKTVEFTVGDPRAYDEDVNYVFTSTLAQGSRISSGAQFALEMTVATARDKMPGPMTIELPIPDGLAYVTLLKARTKSKGANVLCPPSGELPVTMSSWNSTLSDQARAVINIAAMCNVETVNDTKEDEWVVEFDLQILDNEDLFASETTLDFGVGVKFSGNQIFIGGEEIKVINTDDLGATHVVKAITITDSAPATWPGSYVLQWSPDRKNFFTTNLEWGDPTAVTQTTFTLKRPIVAQHVRLTTPTATGSPAYNYTIDSAIRTDIVEFLGDTAAAETLAKRFMFALDDDLDTCLNLPIKDDTEVPPFLIGLVDTRILKDNAYPDDTPLTKSFKIDITGEGISCNTSGGPQRTLVYHPKETMSQLFHGKLGRCPMVTEEPNYNGTSKTRCQYDCACDSADTCKYVLLAMIHDDTPGGSYNLCDFILTENP